VVSHLFVVIIKCRFDFPMVAMGEPDPCCEPHPRKLRYYEASKHALSNDFIITIYKEEHTMEERAVLATFLRMQREWPHRLRWKEGRKGREINH